MFYSKSAHSSPGAGADESISVDDFGRFDSLNAIRDWRKILSNFWPTVPAISIDGMRWTSVEHYFHANKFRISHPDYYREFSLDSDSMLSKMIGGPVKKAGRAIKMTNSQRDSWDNDESRWMLIKAQIAKFMMPDMRRVLILTDNAILKHRPTTRSRLVTEVDLMMIRGAFLEVANEQIYDYCAASSIDVPPECISADYEMICEMIADDMHKK